MTINESTPSPDLPPPPPASGAKTPTMVVWALVLSILGFCGITAIVGIVLGFVGRSRAKEVGKGVGMSTAAIVIGAAWLVLGVVGVAIGAGDSDTEPEVVTTQEETSTPEEISTPEETSTPEDTPEDAETLEPLEYAPLGVTVDALPSLWNDAISAYGIGNTIPDTIDGDTNVLGLADAFYDNDSGSYVSFNWVPETGEVVSISVGGFTDDSSVATDIVANAAAMVVATTDLDPADAEIFIVDELIGTSLDGISPDEPVAEFIEEDDRTYTFNFNGGSIDFAVQAAIIEQ